MENQENKQTKVQAYNEIEELVQKAYNALSEAESIADEHGLEFTFEPSYGMGGTYYPAGSDDDYLQDLGYEDGQGGWVASSQTC